MTDQTLRHVIQPRACIGVITCLANFLIHPHPGAKHIDTKAWYCYCILGWKTNESRLGLPFGIELRWIYVAG
ncbi:hypothetical protein SERLA73DRAFT_183990, partial [Serpula lacrymans var. lacrymans S7.3]